MLAQKSSRNPRKAVGTADAPMPGHVRQPYLVDLHRTDIHGRVGVAADAAEPPALDVEQDHQHGRRQALRLCSGEDAVLDDLAGGAGLADGDADRVRGIPILRRLRGADR